MSNVILKGSYRSKLENARAIAPANTDERFEVSLILRRRAAHVLRARVAALAAGNRSAGHLTREEFAIEYGTDAADLAAIRAFAAAHGLVVVQQDAPRSAAPRSCQALSLDSTRRFRCNCNGSSTRAVATAAVRVQFDCPTNWMESWKPYWAWITVPRHNLTFVCNRATASVIRSVPKKGARSSALQIPCRTRPCRSLRFTAFRAATGRANASESSS